MKKELETQKHKWVLPTILIGTIFNIMLVLYFVNENQILKKELALAKSEIVDMEGFIDETQYNLTVCTGEKNETN